MKCRLRPLIGRRLENTTFVAQADVGTDAKRWHLRALTGRNSRVRRPERANERWLIEFLLGVYLSPDRDNVCFGLVSSSILGDRVLVHGRFAYVTGRRWRNIYIADMPCRPRIQPSPRLHGKTARSTHTSLDIAQTGRQQGVGNHFYFPTKLCERTITLSNIQSFFLLQWNRGYRSPDPPYQTPWTCEAVASGAR